MPHRDPRLLKEAQQTTNDESPVSLDVHATKTSTKDEVTSESIPHSTGNSEEAGTASSSSTNDSVIHEPVSALDEAALRAAVCSGDGDEVGRILNLPSPPDVNVKKHPSLLICAANQGFTDIVGMLLRAGADVNNAEPKTAKTALMYAAAEGYTMTVLMLLRWGADPDLSNSKSDTALTLAIRGGHLAVVRHLLSFGASPVPSAINATRPKGFLLPLQLAYHNGLTEIHASLVNFYYSVDKYLTDLVRSTLPPGTRLIDPGFVQSQPNRTVFSLQSLSFFPVQVVTNAPRLSHISLQLSFSTPPRYCSRFSKLATAALAQQPDMTSIPDEIILLYVACVDLVNGRVTRPRSRESMPIYETVFFNGSHTASRCLKPEFKIKPRFDPGLSSPAGSLSSEEVVIDVDEEPGFRSFVLGSRLNNGGLNSISLFMAPRQEIKEYQIFQKLLIGAYRVRVSGSVLGEVTADDTDQ